MLRELEAWFGLRAIESSESFIEFEPSSTAELKQENTHRCIEKATEEQIKLRSIVAETLFFWIALQHNVSLKEQAYIYIS